MMNIANPSIPWGDEWRPSRDFRRVSDLFTNRNLRAVAAFMQAAGSDEDLRAIITSGMFAVSRKAQHLAGGGGYIPGNWALPPMSKQRNCLESLRKVFGRTLTAKKMLALRLQSQDACISTQSATAMDQIPSDSVDYIFTDPPYGGAVSMKNEPSGNHAGIEYRVALRRDHRESHRNKSLRTSGDDVVRWRNATVVEARRAFLCWRASAQPGATQDVMPSGVTVRSERACH
jgi:hypothetical protein